jgi:hypothetical protein
MAKNGTKNLTRTLRERGVRKKLAKKILRTQGTSWCTRRPAAT